MLTGQHSPQINKNRGEIKQLKPFRGALQGVRGGGTNLVVRCEGGSV